MAPMVLPRAAADEAPADALTVSADPLPTVQIDGVVWDQEVVGNIVYAVGSFTNARPAGAAAGTEQVPRANALAYDITTGALLDWAPTTNGVIYSIEASADGATLYLGGTFTSLNDVTTWRVGSVSAADASRIPLGASANAAVQDLAVSPDGSTLYMAGSFTQINRSARQRAAAVDLGTQTLTDFAPLVDNYLVRAIAVAADSSAVAIGGAFTSVGGSSNPGYGLAILENDGSLRANNVNSEVRNAGAHAAIMDLEADEQGLYGAAYSMNSSTGNIEGVFRANWSTGDLDYLADCHGDSYDVHPTADVLYASSHTHDCSNIGGLPDSRNHFNAVAFANHPVSTVKTNSQWGYADHAGQPATINLSFHPVFTNGTFTGTNQATWTVEGNADYVVYGGEFTAINGLPQQGLVRFARHDIAPNELGPQDKGGAFAVSARSVRAGVVSISFPTNWDRDDRTLVYTVYRDSLDSQPVFSQTVSAGFWEKNELAAMDLVEPGSTHSYIVVVSDLWGAWTRSDWVSVTAASTGEMGDYGTRVLQDGAAHYWPLDETSGESAEDIVAARALTFNGSAYTRGAESVLSAGAGTTFAPTGFAGTTESQASPRAFTVETWFRTSSSTGGPIIGFGSSAGSDSTTKDRMVYMRDDGTVAFMLNRGPLQTLVSGQSYNDGAWHHVVATMSPTDGAVLYIDGAAVASDATMTMGWTYTGFWRVGGDSVSGLEGAPSSSNFTGEIDEVAVYGVPLTAAQVAAHHALGTGAPEPPDPDNPTPEPPADESILLQDSFSRSVKGGWGNADAGGTWRAKWGLDTLSVDETSGLIVMKGARTAASVTSPTLDSTSTDATFDLSLDALPGGSGAYVSYTGRGTDQAWYQATVRVTSSGAAALSVAKVVNGTMTTLGSTSLAGSYAAGDVLHVRLILDGAESTVIRANLWTGDTEPEAWGVDTTDVDAELAEPGAVGFTTYLSSGAGADTVTASIDSLTVKKIS